METKVVNTSLLGSRERGIEGGRERKEEREQERERLTFSTVSIARLSALLWLCRACSHGEGRAERRGERRGGGGGRSAQRNGGRGRGLERGLELGLRLSGLTCVGGC